VILYSYKKGKKVPGRYFVLCICLSLLVLLPFTVVADESESSLAAPPGPSLVVQSDTVEPAWMQLWKRARAASSNGDNVESVALYRKLFVEKPFIEEALREYVILLMELGEWKEAGQVIHKLLEIDSASAEYLVYGGRIALVQKHYELAAKYMGQVYTMSPDGPWALEALNAQIHALQKLDRMDMAYPLMEQLYLLVPHDEHLIRQLARFSKERGDNEKALNYYSTLLTEFDGTDRDYLESIPLFETSNNDEMLVSSWRGYLKFHPFYLPFHKKLSTYYIENNLEHKALTHLLIRIAHGEETPLLFLQTGKVFLYHEGRPDKALFYYDEYRKRNPGDTEVISEIKRIQAILANDLLVIVENEGAWNLWRDLAKVIPDRLAVYYSMAEQLESLDKKSELLEVLEIIHEHNPGDQEILFKLAGLYYNKGLYLLAIEALDSLEADIQRGKDYFILRASIAEKQNDEYSTLNYYKRYLGEAPDDYPVLFKGLQLAGKTGHIDLLHSFYAMLPEKSLNSSVFKKGSFLYGEALIANNLFTLASDFYRNFQEMCELSSGEKEVVADALITVLQSEGQYFEAEQQLRLRLISEDDSAKILQRLIKTNLLNRDWDNAWKWYEYLVLDIKESRSDDKSGEERDFLTKIQILQMSGQAEVAIELLEDYLNTHKADCGDQEALCPELKALIVELYFQNGEYRKAKKIIDKLLHSTHDKPNLLTLSMLIDEKQSEGQHGSILRTIEDQPASVYLDTAYNLEKYKAFSTALLVCEKYLVSNPLSLRARVLKARLLRSLGDNFGALGMFQQLSSEYPNEYGFKQNYLELQFKSAKFTDLIEELAPVWKTVKSGESSLSVRKMVPEISSLPVGQQLLLARSFWADKRFEDALLLYGSLVNPPVEQEFSNKISSMNIELTLPVPEKTFFNIITFTHPAEPDRLTVVMSPQFYRKYIREPEVRVATEFYPAYRWQQIVIRELSVRKAMVDGNYYQAMNEYQEIIEENQSAENFFDLAGVYSRLGFLGKEAALYEILKKESPGYPDLDEASQRNSLKRLPQIAPFFSMDTKDEREEHYDIRQRSGGIQAWFMPSFNHELLFNAKRIYSESLDVEDDLWHDHLEAILKWSPIYDLDFKVALGVASPDDYYSNTFLYDFQVNGRIGDGVRGYLGVSQNIVEDSVEALKKGINEKGYVAGVRLDLLPRLFGGADYLFTEYSDGNYQNRYELWSSYIIHSEPTLLQFRYGYEYSHNGEGNRPKDYNYPSGFSVLDHPYWSPKEYWQHLFTLSFEHQLADDILGRGAPSYYTIEYSFGYEIGGYDNHEVKAQIFLEMSRHFLLNSRVEYISGADVQNIGFVGSVIYRW